MASYSAYEAKARLSEILRRVRAGETVRITYYGEEIAEVRPIERQESDRQAVERLQRQGLLEPARSEGRRLRALAESPGALGRFLEERE